MSGKKIALWGLAVKPNADNMRAAPNCALMESLWQVGAKVQACEPLAMNEAVRIYNYQASLRLCLNKYYALQDAHVLAICNEWQQFHATDFAAMEVRMRGKVVVDGLNLYQPQKIQGKGWAYLSGGRVDT